MSAAPEWVCAVVCAGLFWPDVGVIPCARHADAPHWAPWDQPPESAYDEGIDGTLWDRKAIGATSDGHLW